MQKSGCPYTIVKIRLDELMFSKPENPGDWLMYTYGTDGEWHANTRTLSPWNKKILNGLQKCFKNGIDGLMTAIPFEKKMKILGVEGF